MASREQHVQRCIDAAEARLKIDGDVRASFDVFAAGMADHEFTRDHLCLSGGALMMEMGVLNTPEQLRKFMEGFADPRYSWTYVVTKGFGSVEMVEHQD